MPGLAAGGAKATVHPGDRILLADVGEGVPTVLVLNQVDRTKDKSVLLPLLAELGTLRNFAAIVPISALHNDGDVSRPTAKRMAR